jgi:5-methylcytosine-specific restriction endonuclease McrA
MRALKIEGVRRRMQQTSLSDEELVSRIAALCLEGRRLVARLIVHLIEVEDRALDKKSACSSMWEFCTERLKMSDGEASRRLNAARLVRRFPSVLGRIERGEIHLSALRQLRPYLEEENVDAVLDEAKGKNRSQLEEMIARRFPRPNAPTIEIPMAASMTTATVGAPPPPPAAPALACPARIEPLSATGVLVQMTMTAEGYADLKRAKELLGHCIPDGDTVKVIERALRTLVEDLERERRAKTSRPRASVRPSKPGHISAATRRAVFARDGERCTYVDSEGRRCECRTRIELDHVQPRARGGSDEASNLRARCRSHNLHAAEEIFGKEHVAARIYCRQEQRRKRGRRENIHELRYVGASEAWPREHGLRRIRCEEDARCPGGSTSRCRRTAGAGAAARGDRCAHVGCRCPRGSSLYPRAQRARGAAALPRGATGHPTPAAPRRRCPMLAPSLVGLSEDASGRDAVTDRNGAARLHRRGAKRRASGGAPASRLEIGRGGWNHGSAGRATLPLLRRPHRGPRVSDSSSRHAAPRLPSVQSSARNARLRLVRLASRRARRPRAWRGA